MDNELQSQPAVLHMTVQVTRKDTGKVEEYTITGTPLPPEQPQEQPKETAQ